MKISAMERFFAGNWPIKIWIGTFVGVPVGLVFRWLLPTFVILDSFWTHGVFLGLIVITALVFYFGAIVVGCLILPPFFRIRERLNGAPFVKGDEVEILYKPRRGQRAVVSGVWPERFEAKLDLGEEARKDLSDRYGFRQIRRVVP